MCIRDSYTVDANTTANIESVVTVLEGSSVTISCTSTGAPTPAIIWKLNNETAPFTSTTTETESLGTLARNGDGNFVFNSLSTIVSNLLITNAQYPDHDGNYTCIGFNDNQMINTTSATITVQVLGKCI